jgi:hypothetical protein
LFSACSSQLHHPLMCRREGNHCDVFCWTWLIPCQFIIKFWGLLVLSILRIKLGFSKLHYRWIICVLRSAFVQVYSIWACHPRLLALKKCRRTGRTAAEPTMCMHACLIAASAHHAPSLCSGAHVHASFALSGTRLIPSFSSLYDFQHFFLSFNLHCIFYFLFSFGMFLFPIIFTFYLFFIFLFCVILFLGFLFSCPQVLSCTQFSLAS